jgi:hypothetical protein
LSIKIVDPVAALKRQEEGCSAGIPGSGKLREWDVGKINLTRFATN